MLHHIVFCRFKALSEDDTLLPKEASKEKIEEDVEQAKEDREEELNQTRKFLIY